MSQTPTVSPVEEVVEFFAQWPSRQDIAAFRLSEAAHQLDQMVLLDDIVSLIRARVHGS